MLTTQRRATTAALILTGSLLLTSCGGSDSNSSDSKTLKLWHYEGPDSAMGVAWNEAIKEFEAQHPGVKVKFEEKGFEQIQTTAPNVTALPERGVLAGERILRDFLRTVHPATP